MKNDPADPAVFADHLAAWLDDPQHHLNNLSRRKTLEMIATEYAERVRSSERNRSRARDIVLVASVVTAIGVLWQVVKPIFQGGL